ncbi:NAD(P)H-hydrate epimerase [Corynebacterium yudongzhengii]|uniref:NAD(P)H-hydrate epimerase n=1 Tax=Corynebacterium yudongzhengii TaxID=2080740 RepID=UPI0026DA5B29
MPLNAFTYTADQVRAAEEPLLATQREPDQLMRSAAHAVAVAAGTLLPHNHNHNHAHPRVLVLAGSGGNGGDALYAMAELLESTPLNVEVILTSRSGKVHELALTTCKNTGATVVDEPSGTYDLVIDGILGLGGAGDLREDAARLVRAVDKRAVLSVDVPSGIGADDPTTPPPLADGTPTHVSADVTVTFGGYRLAHGLSAHCGEVLLADPHTHAGNISEHLPKSHITLSRAATPSRDYPAELRTLAFPELPDLTPRAEDDKYSGGVVGICAGSQTYPGAAVLATTGAVRTTSSMVRYAGPQALEVVRALPEVVATTTVAEAGRVQSWVFGPGSGTEDTNTLADILATDLPVLIDADGLTLLTHHEPLREQVAQRTAPHRAHAASGRI